MDNACYQHCRVVQELANLLSIELLFLPSYSPNLNLSAHDLPTSKIAELSDVSRPTINQLLFKLRTRIAQFCDTSSPFSGEVEADESSFGGRRVRG